MDDRSHPPDPDLLNRVATLLSEYPGHAFCTDCLTKRLALEPGVAWRAAVALGQAEKFDLDVGFCSDCLDNPKDVAHVRWVDARQETNVAPPPPAVRFTVRSRPNTSHE